MSDSDSSDFTVDESKVPPVAVCTERINEFVQVTQTNAALAQSYLQSREWDVERSILDFFDSDQYLSRLDAGIAKFVGDSAVRTSVPPNKFTFLSWNIDGLDQNHLLLRTKEVCRIISQEKVDIVFLQEVVADTAKIIGDELPEYHQLASSTDGYFNVTLIRIFTVHLDAHQITPLCGTAMSRKLLTVQAHIGTMKLTLINTHLESTADYAAARVEQLKQAFKAVTDARKDNTVIFAGDLNVRDKEIVLAGGLPSGVEDMWEVCGERKEAKYTWDLKINTNKQMPGRFQPRLRFDRTYVRHAEPRVLVPKHFGLEGIQKTPGTVSFPSDHWGIRTWFEITKN